MRWPSDLAIQASRLALNSSSRRVLNSMICANFMFVSFRSEHLGDAIRDPAHCSGVDLAVGDRAADLVCDGSGYGLGRCGGVVHAAPGAVSGEAVGHMERLLEMVAEGEVQERGVVGHQLHCGGEPALDNRQVTDGQMAVEVMNVGTELNA